MSRAAGPEKITCLRQTDPSHAPHPTVNPPHEIADPTAAGDRTAWFATEIQPHGLQLRSYLRGSFPSVRDVDDVVQESYLRIWRARARQSIRSAKNFLFQIARHVALDQLRHERLSPIDPVADLAGLRVMDGEPDAAAAACSHDEIALLAAAIDALPARCREIFVLRKIQRVPQREIARRLGLSEHTVQAQVSRGMKRCEKFFAELGL